MQLLVIIAALVILALSGYAGWLLGRLWQQRRRRRTVERMRRHQALDGLEIIARSLLAEQVNVSEAALRMAVLLDNLPVPAADADLSAIHVLAGACGDLDIGRARQALSAQERDIQDRQREALEARHGAPVREAARQLLANLPQWRLHASQ